MSEFNWIKNEYLQNYLAYTENTEPPKIMHIWAALSAVSACLGRRCYLQLGIGKLYPNLFVMLIGPPGTRKTSAMNNAKKLVLKNTGVKFAPKDTAGQRQGLITAMTSEDAKEEDIEILDTANAIDQITNFAAQSNSSAAFADRHHMYIAAAELRTFIGQNNLDFTGFLLEMWDGEDYNYQLKNSKATLEDPLLNLIACTTSNELSLLLPPAAMGQGFMSRFILVYAARKYKSIPPSQAHFDESRKAFLKDIISHVAYNLNGAITMSEEAQLFDDLLYRKEIQINDTRFMFYLERRHVHLVKTACALAASRKSLVIEREDLDLADKLLAYTEKFMPEALGEFGLSPIAVAKQKMLDFIKYAHPKPVSYRMLYFVLRNDMKLIDFRNALAELLNAKKIMRVTAHGDESFVYNDLTQEAIEMMAEI